MPSPWKYHPHGSVLFVTFSLEEGLLLLANPLSEAIVKCCLARAQTLYPVTICHFLIEGSHLHMILVVENPHDVQAFVGRFKTESAHMFNRILGRQKRTIWCEGYDSPVVLTETRALACITYLYANPSKDNLVDSIDDYPGLSSWEMFRKNSPSRQWKYFKRPAVKFITADSHNLRGYEKDAKRILDDTKKTLTFTIKPNAWMVAFGITDHAQQEAMNQKLFDFLRHREERARELRKLAKKSVVGKQRLITRAINPHYQSKRKGKRMWCLAERRSMRVAFIDSLKALIERAKSVYRMWFLGDFSERYPLGLYPPSMPKLAEPLRGW